MTTPIDILRRIVASTPCTCAGWPHERCLICRASDALKVPILTPEEGRAAWNKLYGPEGERDPQTGAVRASPPDLLHLADEAIDACEDAKVRGTFSAWEVAGEKVRAYREARREGAIRHVCGPDGLCTYHRTGGVPEYKCSGVVK